MPHFASSGQVLPKLSIAAVSVVALTESGFAAGPEESIRRQLNQIDSLVRDYGRQRVIVGAQIAVGSSVGAPVTRSLGAISPGSSKRIVDDTQFCIGSCSKPFAAVCILAAAERGDFDLDTPIEKWVDEAARLQSASGQPLERSPTLRELLAHRGGIYSQKAGPMTPDQSRAIRDFKLTLSESVAIICEQPLISVPGQRYAYSGAGYCLGGCAAEQAAGASFEELFQAAIAQPLNLSRTTYFPAPAETNIAVPRNESGRWKDRLPYRSTTSAQERSFGYR